ncbi:MAG: hypothetical protein ABIO05_05320 [Ferruginibacter sp.]
MKYYLLLYFLFALLSCNQPSQNKVGHQIAEANGVEKFKDVQMLEFIFNVQHDTSAPSKRHWQWFPKTNEVVFITDSTSPKFKRTDTSTQELKHLNALFTNDEYWLVYPFHLDWDNGMELLDSNMKPAPTSGKSMHKITTKYNNTDGFTPRDMYDLYLDDNQIIREWEYHKGGSSEPSLVTTWENYKDFNGMQLAQDHKTKDGKFHLWFTGIQVK